MKRVSSQSWSELKYMTHKADPDWNMCFTTLIRTEACASQRWSELKRVAVRLQLHDSINLAGTIMELNELSPTNTNTQEYKGTCVHTLRTFITPKHIFLSVHGDSYGRQQYRIRHFRVRVIVSDSDVLNDSSSLRILCLLVYAFQ